MSIRIHELAKRHNMEGKDMLARLKQRGYVSADTKSVSSTVSKIYEEEIDKEFAAKAVATPAPAAPAGRGEQTDGGLRGGIKRGLRGGRVGEHHHFRLAQDIVGPPLHDLLPGFIFGDGQSAEIDLGVGVFLYVKTK